MFHIRSAYHVPSSQKVSSKVSKCKNLLLIREKLAEKAKSVFVNRADKQNMCQLYQNCIRTRKRNFHPRTTKEAHIPVPIGLNITSFKEDGETQIEPLRCIWRTWHTTLKRNSIGSVSLWIIRIRNCFYTRKCFTFGPPTCSRVRAQKSSFWEALLESVTVNQTLI